VFFFPFVDGYRRISNRGRHFDIGKFPSNNTDARRRCYALLSLWRRRRQAQSAFTLPKQHITNNSPGGSTVRRRSRWLPVGRVCVCVKKRRAKTRLKNKTKSVGRNDARRKNKHNRRSGGGRRLVVIDLTRVIEKRNITTNIRIAYGPRETCCGEHYGRCSHVVSYLVYTRMHIINPSGCVTYARECDR